MEVKFTLGEFSHYVQSAFHILSNLKKYIILLLLLQLSYFANAQSTTVSGTVKDPKGETLIGVTVMVKGTGAKEGSN